MKSRWTVTIPAAATIALLAGSIGGCATIRYAYDNAHYLLVEYVDDRLDLDSAQEERLEKRLAEYMSWHRSELLPDYVGYLMQAEDRLAAPAASEEVVRLMDEGREITRRTMESMVPVTARTLADIDGAQHEALAETFRESNEEYREERLDRTVEERRERRQERVGGMFESWIGDLTDQQKQTIHEHVAQWPDTTAAWLEYRAERQTGLLELLGGGASAERIEGYLSDWWFRRDMPEALERDRARISDDVSKLIVRIQDSLLPRQREHLVGRIGDFREQLAAALPPESKARDGVE